MPAGSVAGGQRQMTPCFPRLLHVFPVEKCEQHVETVHEPHGKDSHDMVVRLPARATVREIQVSAPANLLPENELARFPTFPQASTITAILTNSLLI